MAHFSSISSSHIVNDLFNQVHIGRAPENDPDKKTFESRSQVTGKDEVYHTSGELTHTLQEEINRSNEAMRNLDRKNKSIPLDQSQYSNSETNRYAELLNSLRDVGDLKIALSRKKSSEALSLVEGPLKDFGKNSSDHPTSLQDRLLGSNSGFEPISKFMGGDEEAKSFITRMLKRKFLEDFDTALDSGRWKSPEQYDGEAMAQKFAEEEVSTIRANVVKADRVALRANNAKNQERRLDINDREMEPESIAYRNYLAHLRESEIPEELLAGITDLGREILGLPQR